MDAAPSTPPAAARFGRLLLAAAVIGLLGGLVAAGFAAALRASLHLLWDRALPALASRLGERPFVASLVLTSFGGAVVGLALRTLGEPGEIEAVVDNIHLNEGRLPARQSPVMALVSFISISVGGSAGPEAPLVQIIGSIGSSCGDWLELRTRDVRTLTFCGMAAALGSFFGAPLAGALFALEIPHQRGLEYFEALIPATVAATVSFAVFGCFGQVPLALLPWEHGVVAADTRALLLASALGLLGAFVGVVFQRLFAAVGHLAARLRGFPVWLGALGGLALGLIAGANPLGSRVTTLFWGEHQIRELVDVYHAGAFDHMASARLALLLLALAGLKMLAIAVTLRSGFRGGFIFPLFFVGGALGLAVHVASHGWIELPVAVLAVMVAVNVSVTKTPLSSAILLTTFSGISMLPVLLVAALTSFVASGPVHVIRSQRIRSDD